MLVRRIVLPFVALALAGVTAIYARGWIEGQRAQPAQSQAVQAPENASNMVLVAAAALPRGTFVQPGNLRWQAWPDVDIPESYLLAEGRTEEELVGAVVRDDVLLGEPITDGMLVMPGDRGFLAAVLHPNMRAVTVPVDEASSNAGLIFPGDHVDLILTQSLGGANEIAGARRVSETVLEDVRVIAMGREVNSESVLASSGRDVRTTTLEVTPAGAEKVALVTELGKLSLSLRSLAGGPLSETDDPAGLANSDEVVEAPETSEQRFTWDSDVAKVLRPENQPLSQMTVMRGQEMKLIDVRKGAAR